MTVGKGSNRRPAQIPQDELQSNYDRIFRTLPPMMAPMPEQPLWVRCDECKVRHDPAIDCNEVSY